MKEFLSTSEVCDYLGVSLSCVYKLSFNHALPKYCPGGKKIYFKKADIDNWLSRNRVASQEEIEAETELLLLKDRRLGK